MSITPPPGHPRLVAFLGSVRPNSNTGRVLQIVASEAERRGANFEVVDAADLDLALPGRGATDDAKRIQQLARQAEGIVLATPEYHGSFSSVMKLIIDNLGFPSALEGKPVALLGVAAGRIGAIKALEHLRSVASHVGALVLPNAASVSGVRTAFDESGRFVDSRTEQMVLGVATSLIDYISSTVCPALALERMVRDEAEAA